MSTDVKTVQIKRDRVARFRGPRVLAYSWFNLGKEALLRKQYKAAIGFFGKAIEINPKFVSA